MSEKRNINLIIADIPLSLNITSSDEEIIRKAAKEINERVLKYNTEVEKGHIVSQSLTPGSKVKKGAEIVFVISKGPEYVIVPPLKDSNADEAKAQLEEAGFIVKIIEKTNDGSYIANTVAEVSPEEGSSQIKGSEVYLQVWGEAPEDDFDLIPDDLTDDKPSFSLGDLFGW